MIQRNLSDVRALQHEMVVLSCKVRMDGSGGVEVVEGTGFAAGNFSDAGTGLLDVVLPGTGAVDVIACHVDLILASATDLKAHVVSITESTRTIRIRTVAVATATDVPNDDWVMLTVVCKNTSALNA